MATETPPPNVPVQYQLRLPWNYKRQLEVEAEKRNASLHGLIMDALERKYPPKP